MKFARIAVLGAALLVLTTAAAACGGDDDDDAGDEARPTATRRPSLSPTSVAVATQPPATSPTSVPATQPPAASPTSVPATQPPGPEPTSAPTARVTVTAADFSFTPSTFSVSGDTEIVLTNGGGAPHTLTTYRDAAFSQAVDGATTDRVSGGDSETFTLTSAQIAGASELYFRCEIHPSLMQGTITVE